MTTTMTMLASESVIPSSEQRTPDWLEWRSKGLGSSDAAVIMGVSPWKTPYQLWLEKTGQAKDQRTNFAMQRGNELEPKARATYNLEHGIDMVPALMEHPIHPVLRASLDGWSLREKRILEIKCPGRDDHALALSGVIPEKYLWQLAHQCAVADANLAHYYSFDGEKGVTVVYHRDLKLEDALIKAELAFWKLVQSGTPPEYTDRDYKTLEDKESIALFKQYEAALAYEKDAKETVEKYRSQIIARADHPRVRCSGFQVTQVTRKGSVDYSKIEALKGLDLEPYRKASTTFVEIRPVKGAAKE